MIDVGAEVAKVVESSRPKTEERKDWTEDKSK